VRPTTPGRAAAVIPAEGRNLPDYLKKQAFLRDHYCRQSLPNRSSRSTTPTVCDPPPHARETALHFRPEGPIQSAQAAGLGKFAGTMSALKGPFAIAGELRERPFQGRIPSRPTIPGLRPGLTESALQAENPKTKKSFARCPAARKHCDRVTANEPALALLRPLGLGVIQ
jgi:hypothetical protein